jgi:adenosylmethionine-8-amino-7-oxononanoate aminotransferase
MVLGKGITSGYAPEAAVLSSPDFAQVFDDHDSTFHHGHTFGGSPVASAAVVACVNIMLREKLADRAAEMGRYLMKRLKDLEKYRIVGDVRGIGLIAAVELVKDKKTKKVFAPEENIGSEIASKMLERGVKLFGTKGFDTGMVSDFLALAPPLIITKEQIDRIVDVMDESIAEAETRI